MHGFIDANVAGKGKMVKCGRTKIYKSGEGWLNLMCRGRYWLMKWQPLKEAGWKKKKFVSMMEGWCLCKC